MERAEEAEEMLKRIDDFVSENYTDFERHCFWARASGRTWRDISLAEGRTRWEAFVAYYSVLSGVRAYLIENGERVASVVILGVYVDDVSISAVMIDGRKILGAWSSSWDDIGDWDRVSGLIKGISFS